MSRFALLILPVLIAALAGCDPSSSEHLTPREQKIVAQLPMQDAYEHNITRMAELLAPRFPAVPQAQIDQVLREHLTVQDQRRDVFKLYSEEHFNDAELDMVIAATADPAKAKTLSQSLEGRQLAEKLNRLMRDSANDPEAKATAAQRMQQIEQTLTERQQAATAG